MASKQAGNAGGRINDDSGKWARGTEEVVEKTFSIR
jgi:hypothetical protein